MTRLPGTPRLLCSALVVLSVLLRCEAAPASVKLASPGSQARSEPPPAGSSAAATPSPEPLRPLPPTRARLASPADVRIVPRPEPATEADEAQIPVARALARRSFHEVCGKWNDEAPSSGRESYAPGPDACDPGSITDSGEQDAIRRLNLYRWLSGAGPVGTDAGNQKLAQAAALMMHQNKQLSHVPPTTWACYSQEGAKGAGSSNLMLGTRSAADAITSYILDPGENNGDVGHRRWALAPALGKVGIGHYGMGNAMYVFGSARPSVTPEVIAYPAPGYYPMQALSYDVKRARADISRWSFSSKKITGTVAKVTVNGVQVPAYVAKPGFGGGEMNTVVFEQKPTRPGESFEILVEAGGCSWSYRTSLVDCGGQPPAETEAFKVTEKCVPVARQIVAAPPASITPLSARASSASR